MLAEPLSLPERLRRADSRPVGWAVSTAPVPYPEAVAAMEARVAAIAAGEAGELVWLLEHPALYTAGVTAKPTDLLDAHALPVFQSGRGITEARIRAWLPVLAAARLVENVPDEEPLLRRLATGAPI